MKDSLSPPPTTPERTVAVEWPSIAAGPWGRWLGRLYGLRAGFALGSIPVTIGWLLAGLTAPLAALLYLGKKAPRKPFVLVGPINADCRRYRVTTRRVLIEHPFERDVAPLEELPLEAFDRVQIEALPGQAWFDAADVLLDSGDETRLRLRGVTHAEAFVRTLLKTQQAGRIGPANESKAG